MPGSGGLRYQRGNTGIDAKGDVRLPYSLSRRVAPVMVAPAGICEKLKRT